MASTKEFRDYVLEQLALVSGISCRPMMGEFQELAKTLHRNFYQRVKEIVVPKQ